MSGVDESLPGIGPTSPDGTTRRRFLPTPTVQGMLEQRKNPQSGNFHGGSLDWVVRNGESTWSAEDSPASPSPSPGSAEDRTTSDGSGPSSLGSFAYYDLDTSSWRTFQVSLLEEWATYWETWPRAGTTRNGTASRRQPSVPLTSVTGSSSWPTPTVADLFTDKLESSQQSEGSRHSVNLSQAVRWNGYEKRMWATPTEDGNYNRRGASPTSGDGLATQVGGQLNPTWVEWLMGFPLGWTDLEDSATPSSPKSLSGSVEG
jgi:hypothetical protein